MEINAVTAKEAKEKAEKSIADRPKQFQKEVIAHIVKTINEYASDGKFEFSYATISDEEWGDSLAPVKRFFEENGYVFSITDEKSIMDGDTEESGNFETKRMLTVSWK